jgi:hypothetical protein
MLTFKPRIAVFLLISVNFLFTCKKTSIKTIGIKKSINFDLDSIYKNEIRSNEVFLRKLLIKDENNQEFELIALHHLKDYTKFYLIKNKICLDSLLLCDDCPKLLDFNLLKSNKRVVAIYTLRGSCTQTALQTLIKIKKSRIFIPLLYNYESKAYCNAIGSSTLYNDWRASDSRFKNNC